MTINENVLKGLCFPETHYFSPTNIAKRAAKKQHVRKQRLRSIHALCRCPVSPLDDDGLVYRRLVVVIAVVTLRFFSGMELFVVCCLLPQQRQTLGFSAFFQKQLRKYERSNQNGIAGGGG